LVIRAKRSPQRGAKFAAALAQPQTATVGNFILEAHASLMAGDRSYQDGVTICAAEFQRTKYRIKNAVPQEGLGKPLIILTERDGLEPSTPASTTPAIVFGSMITG
jgi:hypothetical protein